MTATDDYIFGKRTGSMSFDNGKSTQLTNIVTNNGAQTINASNYNDGQSPYRLRSDKRVESIFCRFNNYLVTQRLKTNMGFLSFKNAKNISPLKFQFKQNI